MLKVNDDKKHVLLVCDLNPGDVAIIEYDKREVIVYAYNGASGLTSIVALNDKNMHWDSITRNTLRVIRVLESGETLTVI